MKKILPLVLFLIGILVFAGVYFFIIKGREDSASVDDEDQLTQLPIDKRPVLSLIPREDGHWLDMKVEKIAIKGAETLEYLLVYTVEDQDGIRDQGVPGEVTLSGREVVEAPLLLGSESKGHYRYDEGVEKGTLTVKFRNKDGKLLAKSVSEFRMFTLTDALASSDGEFKVTLTEPTQAFVVVMNTDGYPGKTPGIVVKGPYGIFTKGTLPGGSAELSGGTLQRYTGSEWTTETGGDAFGTGVYLTVQ